MMNKDTSSAENRIKTMLPLLNEKQRKIYLATEAQSLGYGGITKIQEISGVSRVTITNGLHELNSGNIIQASRSRKEGGGRKSITEKYPGIADALETLIASNTKVDKAAPLLWTDMSVRKLSEALEEHGYKTNHVTVSTLMKERGFSFKAGGKEPSLIQNLSERNAQFKFISDQSKAALQKGIPVLSIDVKRRDDTGSGSGGNANSRGDDTDAAPDRALLMKELEAATTQGISEIFKEAGFLSAGVGSDAAELTVESLRRWWELVGQTGCQNAEEILITANFGGGNTYWSRLWKAKLQSLANDLNKKITVLRIPPGTSKWSRIDHRFFSLLCKNRGKASRINMAVIISLIGAAEEEREEPPENIFEEITYKKSADVSEEEFESVNLYPHKFHGDWNYTIAPQPQLPKVSADPAV